MFHKGIDLIPRECFENAPHQTCIPVNTDVIQDGDLSTPTAVEYGQRLGRAQCSWSFQSAGTLPSGPGLGWSTG
jgi:hypothetical protein